MLDFLALESSTWMNLPWDEAAKTVLIKSSKILGIQLESLEEVALEAPQQ